MRPFQLTVPLFFGFAVIFDLYNAINDIITESSFKGPELNSTYINSTFVSEILPDLNSSGTTGAQLGPMALPLNSTNYTNFF
jgi:hypothetical protein